ncbi:MAG: hypothetical protein QOG82_1358 [Actinomycetota bacterium]|jgi:hypothetical protein|nr:hypothetical protein [Actinomycetota bacterium]
MLPISTDRPAGLSHGYRSPMDAPRKPDELDEDERQRLHRAHQRLRNASQAFEALTVIEKVRGRWAATPAPPEALEAAGRELDESYREVWAILDELLSLDPPSP